MKDKIEERARTRIQEAVEAFCLLTDNDITDCELQAALETLAEEFLKFKETAKGLEYSESHVLELADSICQLSDLYAGEGIISPLNTPTFFKAIKWARKAMYDERGKGLL